MRKEDEFKCPLCLDVMENPFKLTPCEHLFCKDCIAFAVPKEPTKEEKLYKCPVCRVEITGGELDVQKLEEIEGSKEECEGCQKSLFLGDLSLHKEKCKAFIKLDKKRREKHLLKINKSKVSKNNRSTFKCPFYAKCKIKNLDTNGLIEHLDKKHNKEKNKKGVCPVCASMPWGDPNYISGNVIQHIKARHAFEYNEYVDYSQQNEDEILAQILAKSLEDM